METPWRIELFGQLRVQQGEQTPLYFRAQKTASLFAYLACFPARAHPRDELIEILWPEVESENGHNRLKQTLSELRRQLIGHGIADESFICATRQSIQLMPGTVETDVQEFEAILRMEETDGEDADVLPLQRAVDLYQGPLLPGYYEDWVSAERERLEGQFAGALRRLARAWERHGSLDRAIQIAQVAVSKDPLCEESHRDLMRMYASAGRFAEAMRQYRDLEAVLREELGEAPCLASRELAASLHEEAREGVPVQAPHSTQSLKSAPLSEELEPGGGAVPLKSRFYIRRPADQAFESALERRDSIVLVKGARQTGKTSVLARGLRVARDAGARVVQTDFQAMNEAQLTSPETLFLTLSKSIAAQLDLPSSSRSAWDSDLGPNLNMSGFLRSEALGASSEWLVWGLDEVDRLFACSYHSEVFGLFRSWHNLRSLDPDGPWSRFTLVISYATEVHLFITNLNQSPFNVGTRIQLGDFTQDETTELNRRYGNPLNNPDDVVKLHRLLGGQPYLTRCAFDSMVERGLDMQAIEGEAESEDGLFGGHLRHLLVMLSQHEELSDSVRGVLRGEPYPTSDSFYRLRSAGLLTGSTANTARIRCPLYSAFLSSRLL